MKAIKFYGLVSILALFVISCQKEEASKQNTSLVGKWKLKSTYYSIGGPLIYKQPEHLYSLTFEADGSLTHPNASYTSYKADSNTVTLLNKDNTELKYFYLLKDETLNLMPGGANQCIEGCGEIFVKIK